MGSVPPPNIQLRRLAAELRRMRHAAGLTHEDVNRETRISRNTLSRIENAVGQPYARTVITLLDLYGASDTERESLLALHKAAGTDAPGWLARYDDALPGEYPAYIQFEAEATAIRIWGALFVPGLLQTPDYARTIVETGPLELTEQEISNRVEARMARQVILHRTSRPFSFEAIIDESALRRPIGGPAAMREQLHHLAKAANRPNIRIRVLPESAGAHPGLLGPFVILDFEKTPPAVYLDNISGDVFLQDREVIARFRKTYERLQHAALGEDESRNMLERMAMQIEE